MINYLAELSVIHSALLIGYWFFLRKERQYAALRFYLIGSTVLALAIPLLKLPRLIVNGKESTGTLPVEVVVPDAMVITPAADSTLWNTDLLPWLYLAISAFFFIKFCSGMLYLIYLRHMSSDEKLNDRYIRKVANSKGSFNFFNWIFLSDEIDERHYDVILKHEEGHAALGHTYDLMFFELFKVCFWWLPTAWFINREIRTIHEYQADACALQSCDIDHYSAVLIRYTLRSDGSPLTSSFHDGLILKRLAAMKQPAKNLSAWKPGVLLALCALLFTAFACSEDPKKDAVDAPADVSEMGGDRFTPVEEQPAFDGGMEAFYRYVENEVSYPLPAQQRGIEGRVDVQFVVERDGSISNVKAIMGIGAGCDDEAVRVVQNAPSFRPGTQQGKAVRVRMVMPIIFSLSGDKTNDDNSAQGIITVAEAGPKNGTLNVDATYVNGEWSGTVRDPEGEILPGANIVVAGTTTGTVSGLHGTFNVKADRSKDLLISFVGYEHARIQGK